MNAGPITVGRSFAVGALALALAAHATAQGAAEAVKPDDPVVLATQRGIEVILNLQEGENKAEWPYEGVYRVAGQIPIGYRVGGTAICAMALMDAPGFDADASRTEAVARAREFVCGATTHQLMDPTGNRGYDVRGWGYTYGLQFLLKLKAAKLVPNEKAEVAEKAIVFYLEGLKSIEIPQVGGWNYARSQDPAAVSPPSPFMTAPTLRALFEAKRQGYAVDAEIVKRGLDYLQAARGQTGSVMYSGKAGERRNDPTPGAVGRMLCTETTLYLAGRTSLASVRGAVDAFLTHWSWLDKRRAQRGTHEPPYNIAPYYFYYAHFYAAEAIEMLPANERKEYRRRLHELIFSVKLDDGSWNDRVFPRTANYGTAMALCALNMANIPKSAGWNDAEN